MYIVVTYQNYYFLFVICLFLTKKCNTIRKGDKRLIPGDNITLIVY